MASRGNRAIQQFYKLPVPPPSQVKMAAYRPVCLDQPPDFRAALKEGKTLVGSCMTILNSDVARFTSNIGFDFLFLDLEHTPMSPETARDIIRSVHAHSEGDTHVIVRIPTFGHEWVAWMLDAGAAGIVVPHSETAEQAKQIVEAAKFPPLGKRSYPPFTAVPGLTDGLPKGKQSLYQVYNEHAAIIMQIESKKGCENAEEILAVPGVDATMIGAGDLRLELGLPPTQDGPEASYQTCVQQVFKAAKNNGDMPVFGFAFGPAFIESKVKQGYRGIMVTSDVTALVYKQMADLKLAREMIEAREANNGSDGKKTEDIVPQVEALSVGEQDSSKKLMDSIKEACGASFLRTTSITDKVAILQNGFTMYKAL